MLISIPIIVWGSQLILRLIDRFPLIILFGGGLLGWIAGGMLLTDSALKPWLAPTRNGIPTCTTVRRPSARCS